MNSRMFISKIRNSNAVYSYIPAGAGIGWPVPVYCKGTLCVCLLFFAPLSGCGINAYAVTADYNTLEIVKYENLMYCKDIMDNALCCEYAEKIKNIPENSYIENKRRMYDLCGKYFECLSEDRAADGVWYDDFLKTFACLIEPDEIKYYDFINHEFLNEVMKNI